MSFILYVVVLVVSVSSVMMGLDWLSTPPPPLPKSVQTVSAPAKPVAPAASKKIVSASNESKQTESKHATSRLTTGSIDKASSPAVASADMAKATSGRADSAKTVAAVKQPNVAATPPETAGSAPANAAGDTLANGADGATIVAGSIDDVNGATAQANAVPPRCDVQACAQHYRTFSASDCTYQPFDGPRRLCTVGNPPSQANAAPADVQTSDASKQPASCNYDACAAAYHSFDPATCTWQPFEGPRRLCEK